MKPVSIKCAAADPGDWVIKADALGYEGVLDCRLLGKSPTLIIAFISARQGGLAVSPRNVLSRVKPVLFGLIRPEVADVLLGCGSAEGLEPPGMFVGIRERLKVSPELVMRVVAVALDRGVLNHPTHPLNLIAEQLLDQKVLALDDTPPGRVA